MLPDRGYIIADVTVDGISQGAIESYSFTNVQADHRLEVRFVKKNHTISASASLGGEITPNGDWLVLDGEDQSFEIAALPGYLISDVLVDAVSQGALESYTFTTVSGDHRIEAVFVPAGVHPQPTAQPTVIPTDPTNPPDVPAAVPEPGTFLLLGGGLLGLLAATRRARRK